MAFYERIVSDGDDNISVHSALACAREVKRGTMASKAAYSALALDASEEGEFADLVALIGVVADGGYVWDCFYLAKRKVDGYTTAAELEAKIKGKGIITV